MSVFPAPVMNAGRTGNQSNQQPQIYSFTATQQIHEGSLPNQFSEIQCSLHERSPENGTSVDKLILYILWVASGLSACWEKEQVRNRERSKAAVIDSACPVSPAGEKVVS